MNDSGLMHFMLQASESGSVISWQDLYEVELVVLWIQRYLLGRGDRSLFPILRNEPIPFPTSRSSGPVVSTSLLCSGYWDCTGGSSPLRKGRS
jgi:hypothetical protein